MKTAVRARAPRCAAPRHSASLRVAGFMTDSSLLVIRARNFERHKALYWLIKNECRRTAVYLLARRDARDSNFIERQRAFTRGPPPVSITIIKRRAVAKVKRNLAHTTTSNRCAPAWRNNEQGWNATTATLARSLLSDRWETEIPTKVSMHPAYLSATCTYSGHTYKGLSSCPRTCS